MIFLCGVFSKKCFYAILVPMEYDDFEDGVSLLVRSDEALMPPPEYKVILLNDDFTTKDFVVFVLENVFQKSPPEAVTIMEAVHRTGKGIAGIYTYDIAATRAKRTMQLAAQEGFPLRCELEKK